MTVRVRAPGKVNLYLAVGRPGADGYHPLATIFQAVSIYDTITVHESDQLSLSMTGRGEGIAVDGTNLAIRAAMALAEYAAVPAVADIEIDKQIPLAGGMAGGSADAAGTLVALNALWGLDLAAEQLREIGAGLGADVPFCLMGGTALGRGRGDQLTPLLARGTYDWLFITQPDGISTPQAFAEFDRQRPAAPEVPLISDDLLAAISSGDVWSSITLMENDLTGPARALHPGTAAVLDACAQLGYSALLSGSGPTVAVSIPEGGDPVQMAAAIKRQVPGITALAAHGPVPGPHVV